MKTGSQLLRLAGGSTGLAVLSLLLAVTVGLAVVLHWSAAAIGGLALLGVALRRALTAVADARDERAETLEGSFDQA